MEPPGITVMRHARPSLHRHGAAAISVIGAAVFGSACGDSSTGEVPDARLALDAPGGVEPDAGAVDAPVVDAAGPLDAAGPPDGEVADAGAVDAPVVDAQTPPTCAPVHTIGVAGDAIYAPYLGMDAAGGAVALWRQGEFTENHAIGDVHGGRLDPDTGWHDVTAFVPGGGYPATSIAVAPSGAAVAVWQADVWSTDHQIWTSRYGPGVGWTAPTALPTDVPPDVFGGPRVAIGVDGDVIAMWDAEDGVRVMRLEPTGWSGSVRLDEGRGAGLAIGPGGVAIALWTQNQGATAVLRASRYVPDVGWEAPTTLDEAASAATGVDVGFAGNGDLVVKWQSGAGVPAPEIWTTRHVVGTGWGDPVRLDRNETPKAGRLAVAASGRAVVVWEELAEIIGDDTTARFAARTFDPSTGWSAAEPLPAEQRAYDGPQVVIAADGAALLVWQAREDSTDEWEGVVYARRFVPGVGWSEPFRLLDAVPGELRASMLRLRIAMNGAGQVVVAWTSWVERGRVLRACAYR